MKSKIGIYTYRTKTVLIVSFFTNRRTPKCSHRLTMLRFRCLAWQKNSSIIYGFCVTRGSDWLFLGFPNSASGQGAGLIGALGVIGVR